MHVRENRKTLNPFKSWLIKDRAFLLHYGPLVSTEDDSAPLRFTFIVSVLEGHACDLNAGALPSHPPADPHYEFVINCNHQDFHDLNRSDMLLKARILLKKKQLLALAQKCVMQCQAKSKDLHVFGLWEGAQRGEHADFTQKGPDRGNQTQDLLAMREQCLSLHHRATCKPNHHKPS